MGKRIERQKKRLEILKRKALAILPNGAELVSFEETGKLKAYHSNSHEFLMVFFRYKGETFRTLISSQSNGREHKSTY